MKLKALQYLDGKEPRKFYIIRPEIEVAYTKHKVLGKLYIIFNYIAFPYIYRKAAENETV